MAPPSEKTLKTLGVAAEKAGTKRSAQDPMKHSENRLRMSSSS